MDVQHGRPSCNGCARIRRLDLKVLTLSTVSACPGQNDPPRRGATGVMLRSVDHPALLSTTSRAYAVVLLAFVQDRLRGVSWHTGARVAEPGSMRTRGFKPKIKRPKLAKRATVSFVNMPPQEEIVAAVKDVASRYSIRTMASLERLTTGSYRACVRVRGRDGDCADPDVWVALTRAFAQVALAPQRTFQQQKA
jgi:hypothetical protein